MSAYTVNEREIRDIAWSRSHPLVPDPGHGRAAVLEDRIEQNAEALGELDKATGMSQPRNAQTCYVCGSCIRPLTSSREKLVSSPFTSVSGPRLQVRPRVEGAWPEENSRGDRTVQGSGTPTEAWPSEVQGMKNRRHWARGSRSP
jgi:hypothetical protein